MRGFRKHYEAHGPFEKGRSSRKQTSTLQCTNDFARRACDAPVYEFYKVMDSFRPEYRHNRTVQDRSCIYRSLSLCAPVGLALPLSLPFSLSLFLPCVQFGYEMPDFEEPIATLQWTNAETF